MPRFDGSGPMGQGPVTGRGMGQCNSAQGREHPQNQAEDQSQGLGWLFGFGRGVFGQGYFGRGGWGRGYFGRGGFGRGRR